MNFLNNILKIIIEKREKNNTKVNKSKNTNIVNIQNAVMFFKKNTQKIIIILVIIIAFLIILTKNYLNITFSNINMISQNLEKIEISVDMPYANNKVPLKININAFPSKTVLKDIKWSISDENILEIKNNLLYGKKKGKAEIFAISDSIQSNKINVEIVDFLENIEITNSIKELKINHEHTYNINAFPDNAFNTNITIESTNNNIIEVVDKEKYTIKAKNRGDAKIIFKDSFR